MNKIMHNRLSCWTLTTVLNISIAHYKKVRRVINVYYNDV